MKKWKWLRMESVLAMNAGQIATFGGIDGLRDEGLLDSALARPENLAAYGEPSVFDLAAAYASDIIRNHPFLDGNKRTGLVACFSFLLVNGWEVEAPEAEAYMAVMALAQKEIDETAFARWLKENSKRIKKK